MMEDHAPGDRGASRDRESWRQQPAPPRSPRKLDLTSKEAAAALCISERSVRRAIANGTLIAAKQGSSYRIAPDEVDRFAAGLPRSLAPRPMASVVAFPGAAESVATAPEPLSSFIGRDQTVADVTALLIDTTVRLVTLTGPGGIGKTRLAQAAAAAMHARFPDGVTFVALESVHRAEQVMPAIAQALGLRERAGQERTAQLATFLRRKRLLLVLDNFEQIVDAGPEVAALLASATMVTALITSRAPLRISGERELPVPSLALAGERATVAELLASEAGCLFVERAQAHAPAFTVNDETAPAIANICARLDGLPLAIELAAARVKVLRPPQMLARLERRLPLLTRGARNAPPRHGTMRDAIAWSYDLLSSEEQTLFRRLSVFAGGFTLEAIEAISPMDDGGRRPEDRRVPAPDPLDLLSSLVDKSLLRPIEDAVGEPRFAMLETIREFALECLGARGEEEAMRSRHAAAYMDFAAQYEFAEMMPGGNEVLARLDAEHANLRLALGWLAERNESRAFLRLVASLGHFWRGQGHYQEGRGWLVRALACIGDTAAADRATATVALGIIEAYQGANHEAVIHLAEGLAACQDRGDAFNEATALIGLGAVAVAQGDHDRGTALLEESLTAAHAIADQRLAGMMAGWGLLNLAIVPRAQGNYTRAAEQVEAALLLARNAGHAAATIQALADLGDLSRDQGEHPRAMECYQEALALGQENPGNQAVSYAIEGMGMVAVSLGDAERGARLLGAAEALRERIGLRFRVRENQVALELALAATRAALGEQAFATAWAAGLSLTPAQAVVAALEQFRLSTAEAGDGLTAHEMEIQQLLAAGLTRRESEVLRRLALLQSDREIAAALFLSRRTVQWHVRAILAKLEATSRGEAVTRARARGLI
jgi:excisionase family DNA binding protein